MTELLATIRQFGLRLLAVSLVLALGAQAWPQAHEPAQMAAAHGALAQMFVHPDAGQETTGADLSLCAQHCLTAVALVPGASGLSAPDRLATAVAFGDIATGPILRLQPDAPPPRAYQA